MQKLVLGLMLSMFIVVAAASESLTAGDQPPLESILGSVVEVKTSGGGDFRGTLFTVGEDRVELMDAEGAITGIGRSAILSIRAIDLSANRAEYFQDSASNRLIIMPTGFGMKAGEFHVAAQEIVVITTSYGISSNFSVWGGISIPGALVNLRWSTGLGEHAALSLGSFLGLSWFNATGLVLPYAITSFGSPNSNLTLGAGLPIAWAPSSGPRAEGVIGTVGGKIIVSPTTSIVTENWIIAISDGWAWSRLDLLVLPAAVFRIAGERLSWDIGAVAPLSIYQGQSYLGQSEGLHVEGSIGGVFVPLPLISITYRIN